MTQFQTLFLQVFSKWANEEKLVTEINDEDKSEIEISIGDLKVSCFPSQVDIIGPNLYRRFENWNPNDRADLVEEVVKNISFYLKNPLERDIPSLRRPDFFARWILGKCGIRLIRKIK
ncbi:hypothetical protein [Bdellovibrio sp. HCB337]|uniref:hypothetical protein n=1 Tax=Bdellovibrio sp. HCB337 TaxID=3394358 RepID=UPI0039A54DA2